jgi:hypothetical protein
MEKSHPAPLPTGSLIASTFERRDYVDAYSMALPAGAHYDLDTIVRSTLGSVPGWISLLMHIRDGIVGMVGLKTARDLPKQPAPPASIRVGDQLRLFKVLARTEDELLMGEDDWHLDFRVSLLLRRGSSHDDAIVSTLVRFNHWFGRAYFLPVRPLHRRIVPALMRHSLRRLENGSPR